MAVPKQGDASNGPGRGEQERLIRLLETSRRATLAALRGVDDLATVYAEGPWRIKDVLGHIASREREVLACLQALHEGDEPYTLGEPFSQAEYNQRKWAARRHLDAAQLRMDWAMVRRDLQFAVADLAPDQLTEPLRFPWGEYGTVSALIEAMVAHEAEHLAHILAALHPASEP